MMFEGFRRTLIFYFDYKELKSEAQIMTSRL